MPKSLPLRAFAGALLPIALTAFLFAQSSPPLIYRNLDPTVPYTGSQSCATSGCHETISRNYALTPMGHSMAPANSPAELARVPNPVTVFSPKVKRYYTVFRRDNDLYQSVYQLDKKGKKAYELVHKMDNVVGGGLTGYSYIFRVGQWFFQAPLSYYSGHGTWELSPGYQLDDIGFTRQISTACLSCHNGQPIPVPKRDGMYQEPFFRFGEMAMSCEVCHGPGQLHRQEMDTKRGQPRDTGSNAIDTSIVNPAHLAPNLADDLCMECHQSGDAIILMPGKGFLDYRPGQPLYQTMAIFRRPLKEEQRDEANRLETAPPVRGSPALVEELFAAAKPLLSGDSRTPDLHHLSRHPPASHATEQSRLLSRQMPHLPHRAKLPRFRRRAPRAGRQLHRLPHGKASGRRHRPLQRH